MVIPVGPGGISKSKKQGCSQCARSASVTTAWCQRGGLSLQPYGVSLAVTQEPCEASVTGFSVGDRDTDKI